MWRNDSFFFFRDSALAMWFSFWFVKNRTAFFGNTTEHTNLAAAQARKE